MKKYMQWVVVPALFAVFMAPTGAQAYTTTYQTPAQQQQIAYLYALVAQLQAQLNAILAAQGQSQSGVATNYVAITSENVADASNDSVQFSGTASIKQSGTARFWFEYGTTKDVPYSTESRSVSNARTGNDVSFTFTAPDIDSAKTYYYRAVAQGADGRYAEGSLKSFTYSSVGGHSTSNSSSGIPQATADSASSITTYSAKISGRVDMNDYENGTAFLVYGESETRLDNVTDEYDFDSVSSYGYELRKVSLSTNLDSDRSFTASISGLHDDTKYFYRFCVQYEDAHGHDRLACSDVEHFYTDRN
jgi:phosphodiesterase/alkaline phosphatase D-like protein